MVYLLAQSLSMASGVAGDTLEAENSAFNAEERARTDRFNAIVAEQEAKSELEGARGDASDFRRAQSARVASSRARAAGSGFALEGSPLLVDQAALSEIEFGVTRIMYGGQLKAGRLRTQASLLRRSATVEDINAKTARQAGKIAAVGSAARGVAGNIESMANAGVSFG